ncbi:MAG TPA: glycosyltransferase [Planctomycetota bacterium]|nr:glycosyltransferase [Planctomycetota bacterium]
MPAILCNLPLECFEDRAAFAGIDLVTYGPPERMLVDGVHFPFDVAFDPSTGSWEDLQRLLPHGFRPDFVLHWWPDQEPLPAGMHRCPVPVVGVVSDYNLSLPYLVGLWPFYDVLLCDRAGVDLFAALSFADVRWFCQYTFKRPFHRRYADVGERDLDVAFVGNLDPDVQRARAPWLERVRALAGRGHRTTVQSGICGAAYGRLLNRARIGFNRSIRGEMNLRAFEVPACGALLFLERENLEVREFLTPGAECVLYGEDDFEALVDQHLRDEPRRARIAAAGHARIQDYAMGKRLQALCELLGRRGPGRPPSRDADAALGRATAMLQTWASGPALTRAAVAACQLLPEDPRPLNVLALATLRWRGNDGIAAAIELWRKAARLSPGYVPAVYNLEVLLGAAGRSDLRSQSRRELDRRLLGVADFGSLDGPTMPLGFKAPAIARSLALQAAVRAGSPAPLVAALAGTGLLDAPRT